MKRFCLIILIMISLIACEHNEVAPSDPDIFLTGGETTVFSSGPDAFTFPLANLDQEGLDLHFIADGVFGQHFVSAPAVQFGGIGPLFNQNSCESCHVRNGRGTIPQFEGDANSGLLLRLSIPGAGANGSIVPAPGFGGQLQNKAIFGVTPEGKVARTEEQVPVTYADGTEIILTKPTYFIKDPYTSIPAGLMISPRIAPPVHGLGLVEAIPETDILALVDEFDADQDGISGKPNRVWDVLEQKLKLGRYGWKAENSTADQQAADAAHNDMGLTNFFFANENCEGQLNCEDGLQETLDVNDETTEMFSFYFKTVAVPAQRDDNSSVIRKGRSLFEKANCTGCHNPGFVTGDHEIQALAYQKIFPYTDLLLHDMGEGLSDGRPTFSADGREWRTPPLWGIGLTKIVNPKATFLHDGRAATLEEAILWHGGEAEASKEFFRKMSESNREALLDFLNSL